MNIFKNYNEYQVQVIDTLKKVLYQKDNNIFDKLDFDDDEVFSEPLLFSCINHDFEEWIDSLIFGLTKNKTNLKGCYIKPIDGRIMYIPNLGYLITEEHYDQKLKVYYFNDQFKIYDQNRIEVEFKVESVYTSSNGIEIMQHNHPLFEPLYVDNEGSMNVFIDNQLIMRHINHLNNALLIIKDMFPEYYALINDYIKKIILFEGRMNSFASIQAHGAIFLKVKESYNEAFFIEDIMHQCAHVFFNALTFDKSDLFQMNHNSDLSSFTENPEDKGHILYGRFHGLFTHTYILICLDQCLKKANLPKDIHFELIGRLVLNMIRFGSSIRAMDKPHKFKQEGLKWFMFFKKTFEIMFFKYHDLIKKCDLSNQPYVFDFENFKDINHSIEHNNISEEM